MLLRAIEQLDEPLVTSERFIRVPRCEVIWANYPAISADFGLPYGDRASFRDEVDAWLVEQCGWVSEAQTVNEACNTAVADRCGSTIAYRPPHYGRAAVFCISNALRATDTGTRRSVAGLIDVKGCGVAAGRVPQLLFHRTGLLSVREALREVMLQQIIERIFRSLGLRVRGVPIYAVLRLGFDAKTLEGPLTPAALILRRAHRRPTGNVELPNFGTEAHKAKLLVELILRRYGMTSANPRARLIIAPDGSGQPRMSLNGEPVDVSSRHVTQFLRSFSGNDYYACDVINIQTSRCASYSDVDVELIDFGHYFAGATRFDHPLISLVNNMPLNFGCLFRPDTPKWVQPVPELMIRPELFAKPVDPPEHADELAQPMSGQPDRFAVYVNQIAIGILDRTLSRHAIGDAVSSFVFRACGHLPDRAAANPYPLGLS